MEFKRSICDDLKIPASYLSEQDEGNCLCLVHEKWLQQLLLSCMLPSEFPTHDKLSDVECKLLLLQRQRRHVGASWRVVEIRAFKKSNRLVQKLRKYQKVNENENQDLGYSQLLHYISETNFKNLWKDAYNRHSFAVCGKQRNRPEKLVPYSDVIREALKHLYCCPFVDIGVKLENVDRAAIAECDAAPIDGSCHQNILSAYCILESNTYFYVIHPHMEHSIADCVTFSPSILGNSSMKPLFVVYQILHAVRDLHDKGLCLGDITLHDLRIDRNLWVCIHPKFWQNLTTADDYDHSDFESNDVGAVQLDVGHIHLPMNGKNSVDADKPCVGEADCIPLNELTNLWVQGVVSNYHYLMALNSLAGRQAGNPNHHPVLPWVMDFTVPNGGWRDLSRSKFRLNKGDRQLDLTYESLPSGTSAAGLEIFQVPHHVTDVLSEITYYVYKARRTPTSVLCQYVRSNWVPAEYPSSMQRLYDWTPDECIPEFFTDPLIFHSIHDDLADLEVPWWASSPEDFIHKHAAALEGHHVSERLHHWIDLTFGYKLSGPAAVKAKNVCLHLVDQHTALTSGGVVQLFSHPHPHRLGASLYLDARPPFLHKAGMRFHGTSKRYDKVSDVEVLSLTLSTSSGASREQMSDQEADCATKYYEKRKGMKMRAAASSGDTTLKSDYDCHQVVLPKDYNPLALLNQLETMCNFTAKTTYKLSENKIANECKKTRSFHQQTTRDMVVVGCLLVEIFMAAKLRALHSNSTLDERYEFIRLLLKVDFSELPRCARQAVRLLLQLGASENTIPKRMPTVTDTGLPPPSAHQLLQSLIQVFPFPSYFTVLYSFLCKLKCYGHRIGREWLLQIDPKERSNNIEALAETEVKMAAAILPGVLDQLNEEGLDLLVPYLQEMFESQHTSVMTAWYLFNMVGQLLGPQQTAQKFLDPLTRLFDPDCATSKHLKMFHRSYLLQLLIRLGLQTFLAHFSTLLVEAVSGFKDFGDKISCSQDAVESTRKGSHLRSPVLESLAQDSEVQKIDDEGTLSPFDENSSQTEVASPWSRSEAENASVTVDPDAEPEIFTFENAEDEFCADASERLEVDIDVVDQFEQKSSECSSDSTSVGALSIGDTNIEGGHSPVAEEDDGCDAEKLNAASFSEGFRVPVGRRRDIHKAESYSSSVPNIPSAFLSPRHSEERKEAAEGSSSTSTFHGAKPHETDSEYNISDVATESITWLSHRLGPVLTAKYLSRNLLRMVSLCYLGEYQQEFITEQACGTSPTDLSVTISPHDVVGDINASKVFDCLTNIASLYGEQFVVLQYLPHVMEILCQCKKRITPACEAGLIGGMALVRHVIPYLSSQTLMDHLQDTIIKEILYPAIRLISSQRLNFPDGGHARLVVAFKLLDALHLIGLRIGFEMTRKHLTPTLQRFFAAFSRVHGHRQIGVGSLLTSENLDKAVLVTGSSSVNNESSACHAQFERLKVSCDSMSPPMREKDGHHVQQVSRCELSEAFTPELAYIAYIPFCKLAGSIHMEHHLTNDELIHQLCLQHDQALSISNFADNPMRISEGAELSSGHLSSCFAFSQNEPMNKGVSLIGNRIGIHLEEEELVPAGATPLLTSPPGDASVKIAEYPKCDITKLISKQMNNDYRHLRGNWFAYWEHEIGRSEKDHKFNFKQIKLQTFVGHISNVRAMYALDNENSFISASKDKTVKLWSLRSHGTGVDHVPCRFTYTSHKKSVFSVTFLESLRLVASCDSTVHVWDPFMGSLVKQFDPMKNSPVTVLAAMSAPSRVILAATTEATIRFLDVRSLRFTHDYKASLGSAGLIRCLAVSPDGRWIAVGHSTGIISILDVRTGLMINTWKGHEGEVLQIKAFNNTTFVSSSLDQCVSVWNADDGKLKCHLRGPTEPVHCLGFYRNEMISGTTASRIGIHTSVDCQASFSSTRLRSDTFKGVLTSLTVLPLNRLILLGADNGTIRLLC